MFLCNKEKKEIYNLVMESLEKEPENWRICDSSTQVLFSDISGIVNDDLLGRTIIWLAEGTSTIEVRFMHGKSIGGISLLGFFTPWRRKLYRKAVKVALMNAKNHKDIISKERSLLEKRVSAKKKE